jgi:hypothetical protein
MIESLHEQTFGILVRESHRADGPSAAPIASPSLDVLEQRPRDSGVVDAVEM